MRYEVSKSVISRVVPLTFLLFFFCLWGSVISLCLLMKKFEIFSLFLLNRANVFELLFCPLLFCASAFKEPAAIPESSPSFLQSQVFHFISFHFNFNFSERREREREVLCESTEEFECLGHTFVIDGAVALVCTVQVCTIVFCCSALKSWAFSTCVTDKHHRNGKQVFKIIIYKKSMFIFLKKTRRGKKRLTVWRGRVTREMLRFHNWLLSPELWWLHLSGRCEWNNCQEHTTCMRLEVLVALPGAVFLF